jgi:hypothetical protein
MFIPAEEHRRHEGTHCIYARHQCLSHEIKQKQAGNSRDNSLLVFMFRTKDGGSTILRNMGKHLPDWKQSHPRK